MDTVTSRRAIIGAIGLGLPAAALAATRVPFSPRSDSSGWDRTVAEWQKAEAASADFYRVHYDPAYAAAQAEIGDKSGLAVTYAGHMGEYTVRWNDNPSPERQLRDFDRHFARAGGRFEPDEYDRRFRAALVEVLALEKAWEVRRQNIQVKHNLPALCEEAERIDDHAYELRWKLMAMPAPNAAALHWKLAYLWDGIENDAGSSEWSAKVLRPVLADARRLAEEASA